MSLAISFFINLRKSFNNIKIIKLFLRVIQYIKKVEQGEYYEKT